jgi:RNA polymerase sigma-70 factor (ECF subfamily)
MHRPSRDQFEALVRDHHAAVHRAAARWVGAELAADVAQDVFVRVLEGKVRLEVAQSLRATLCWLATRLAANCRRAGWRRNRQEANAMLRRSDPDAAAGDPAGLAAAADLHHAVAELVESLPAELRLPLQLHCQDELTFGAIGTALRVPASTAHDRVQQALLRLRTALAARGLAVAAASLPAMVAAAPAPVPSGLLERLLALGDGAISAGLGVGAGVRWAAGIAALATAVVVAVVGYGWLPVGASPAPTAGGASASAPVAPAATAVPAAGLRDPLATGPAERMLVDGAAGEPSPATQAPPGATFHGTVHDAGGWPVAAATVRAHAAGGLKAFDLGGTTTDAQGAFRFVLEPSDLQPSAVRLHVREGDLVLLETGELALPRAAEAPPLALVLPAAAGTATSRFELSVAVVGADGVPLADVPVALFADASPRPLPDGSPREASARTGGDGAAVLRGRTLGAKWLLVDGRGSGHAAQFLPLALDRAGLHRRQVALAVGGRLVAQVARLDGAPLAWSNVWLEDATLGLVYPGELTADGQVAFAGLGPGPHTLRVSADASLSPAARSGLVAGAAPVAVRLKARDELRDVGDHMAELHGELVDAVTGAVVEHGALEVGVRPVRGGASTLPTDRLQPIGPVQTMVDRGRYVAFHEVGLTAGRWALVATVPGYATTVVEVELRDGELRTGLRVPLQRGGELRGRLVDAAGRPVPRGHVFVAGLGELGDRCIAGWRAWSTGPVTATPPPSQLSAATHTDAEGAFVLRNVPPGVALRLVACAPSVGFAESPPLSLRAGEVVAGLALRLADR